MMSDDHSADECHCSPDERSSVTGRSNVTMGAVGLIAALLNFVGINLQDTTSSCPSFSRKHGYWAMGCGHFGSHAQFGVTEKTSLRPAPRMLLISYGKC